MKIVCIGRNYAEHAKELNNPVPTEPLFFIKPDSAVLRNNDPFYLPDFSDDVHYEAEIYVRIHKKGKNIEEKFAPKYYTEIGIGVDITARDVQQRCKEKGLPWEKAKGFDGSAPLSGTLPLTDLPDIQDIHFELHINGQMVQRGWTGDMLFPVNRIIAEASKYFMLKIGDLIFTGTPAGVGRLNAGDRLESYIEGRKMLDFQIR
ncbi:MAG: fumarylacetoacetate hydrolase family protein [Flavobacteriales bacterium]|nr:fumarylacetoacetate hydrolase family protein [Flavobacteriales bacterium]